ncbi:MAG: glycosyltransferase, partial [Acidobacteria bacterium]|nr:glycosyltransferase [Acidobacteriota bacterium]
DCEILFGAGDPRDSAIADIERLQAEFPQRTIRLLVSESRAPNRKTGVLADLARAARHPVLLVTDSDIRVEPGYLRRIVRPLACPEIGLVTCLYRASAGSLPGHWEALGIATDFAPSVLVAPLAGVREFGLGATLVFRAADLERIGGFEALADYLADDYQLARHITQLGKRAFLAKPVVETFLGDQTWSSVWRHQVRWARTIRVSRGDGYLGLPVTHAGVWAAVAAAFGLWWVALPLAALRIAAGLAAGWGVLRSPLVLRAWPLIPLWDLWAFAVWCAGLCGRTVEWRGVRLRLNREGKIVSD